MNIILVTLLCAVAFGNPLDENKRLKRSNSVLLQALKELTLLTQSELSVGSQAKETIITRRASEVIMIGDEIEIDILRVKASDHEVQFGVTAPAEISVHRKEVYDARHSETAVGMLIMSRKIGQTLMLGQDILFTVEDMRGGQVRFKVTAPADVAVLKKEIYMRDHSENAVGKSEDYSVFDSNGGCGEGLALTEDECKNARIGTWKKASTWSLPETCGCFLEGDNRYFNRLNGACNRPDSGERMICKKITCTNQKEGQCSDWYRKKEWIQIFDVTRDKCHEKCAELAATRGEGCCQFGPESPEHLSQDDSCYFVIGDKVRRLSSSGPSFYEKLLAVSECSA